MTRILIVDDNTTSLYLLEAILKANEYEVVPAGNGAEALELAIASPPDLIITDILMPVMDGFELCRRWKTEDTLRDIPLIFFTATYTDPRDERFALSLGAARFVVKPQKPDRLIEIVRQVLAEGQTDDTLPAVSKDEMELLRDYNEVLYRKLHAKMMQLESEIALHKRTAETLAEQEAFLDAVVENIPDMIFVKDAGDLRFVRFNKAGEELLGYSREYLQGKRDHDLFPEDQADFFTEKDREVLRECRVSDIAQESIRTRTQGTRILHTKKIPICTPEGIPKYLLGISEDITDRVRMEEALRRATNKLNLLNRITFEDIQNAVFTLSGHFALEEESSPEDYRLHNLGPMSDILRTIAQSLEFAKNYQNLGEKPPSWQNIEHTFLFAVSHLTITDLSRRIQVHGLEVYADPLLENVFFILGDNVLRHAAGATEIALSYHETGDGLVILFEDNGPGIPAGMKERIFSRRYPGKTGMGLFLAREILSITDITIREIGEEGNGARFEIFVPKHAYRFTGEASARSAGLPVQGL